MKEMPDEDGTQKSIREILERAEQEKERLLEELQYLETYKLETVCNYSIKLVDSSSQIPFLNEGTIDKENLKEIIQKARNVCLEKINELKRRVESLEVNEETVINDTELVKIKSGMSFVSNLIDSFQDKVLASILGKIKEDYDAQEQEKRSKEEEEKRKQKSKEEDDKRLEELDYESRKLEIMECQYRAWASMSRGRKKRRYEDEAEGIAEESRVLEDEIKAIKAKYQKKEDSHSITEDESDNPDGKENLAKTLDSDDEFELI